MIEAALRVAEPLTEDALVLLALETRNLAETVEAKASPARWREADCYAELSRRGWSTRRIGAACDVSHTTVRIHVCAVERYPSTATRPTFWQAYAEVTGEKKAQLAPVENPPSAPAGTFATIVADPPWRYDNKATRGAAEDHYPTMSVDELAALPVEDWAADQAHLYLWTTNGFLRDSFDVMAAWGFTYKTTLVWVKPQIGMGNYFRSSAEYVLFGIRGGLRTRDCNQPNWFNAPRQRHSQKPGLFFDLVETASFPPYLEMFARQRRLNPEWDYWGNEA